MISPLRPLNVHFIHVLSDRDSTVVNPDLQIHLTYTYLRSTFKHLHIHIHVHIIHVCVYVVYVYMYCTVFSLRHNRSLLEPSHNNCTTRPIQNQSRPSKPSFRLHPNRSYNEPPSRAMFDSTLNGFQCVQRVQSCTARH